MISLAFSTAPYQFKARFTAVKMFTINNSKIILQFASLFFVTCDFSLGAQKKCAEYNEYCQEHWECCSNTCLTYSYRCIGKKHSTPSFDRPALTLEEILEGIAEVNTIPSTTHINHAHSVTSKMNKNILNTLIDVRSDRRVVKALPVLRKLFTAVERNSHIAVTSKEPAFIFFALQHKELIHQSKQLKKEIVAVQNVKAADKPEKAVESATAQTAAIHCKKVGEECYYREDCCTQRCNWYLHHCVT
ncbi:uncharacterized protein [Eurosta solidaginis]|uniref:uncharacterized protein n=1 Tax=Eurosta solidaginis TaxID=178769 RepID=UPI003530AC62